MNYSEKENNTIISLNENKINSKIDKTFNQKGKRGSKIE